MSALRQAWGCRRCPHELARRADPAHEWAWEGPRAMSTGPAALSNVAFCPLCASLSCVPAPSAAPARPLRQAQHTSSPPAA